MLIRFGELGEDGASKHVIVEFRDNVGRDSAFDKALSLHLPLISNILSETRGGICNVLATSISRGKAAKFSNASDSAKPFLKIDSTLKDGKFGNVCREFRGHDC